MEIEAIHFTALVCTAIVILYSDHVGFSYFRGTRLTLTTAFVTWSHRLVWMGLAVMILSGFFMALPAWEYYRADPAFFVKMSLVGVLVINGLFIGKLSHLTTERAFAELPDELRKTLIVSGALSAIGWVGSTVIGFFFL